MCEGLHHYTRCMLSNTLFSDVKIPPLILGNIQNHSNLKPCPMPMLVASPFRICFCCKRLIWSKVLLWYTHMTHQSVLAGIHIHSWCAPTPQWGVLMWSIILNFQRGPSSLKKCSSVYRHADFPERDCLYRFDELLFWIHFHILVFQTTTKIMISDIQLAIFANVLGVSLFLLVQKLWVIALQTFHILWKIRGKFNIVISSPRWCSTTT